MIIDTDTAKTTEEAATELGVSTSKLRDLMVKHDVTVGRWGTQLAFTPADMEMMRGLVEGRCQNCGWKAGEPTFYVEETSDDPNPPSESEATEDTPDGGNAADGTAGG